MNWGDPRDNFFCGNLLPSGVYGGGSYSGILSNATAITGRLRLPVNVDTVTGTWWTSYYATIDAAVAQGLNVPNWQALWERVIADTARTTGCSSRS